MHSRPVAQILHEERAQDDNAFGTEDALIQIFE
jgi:hypothetical protein